jgi:hypothetical protein
MTFWMISRDPRGYLLHINSALRNGHTRNELEAWFAPDPDLLRDMLPPGLRNIGRNQRDEPNLLEIWV